MIRLFLPGFLLVVMLWSSGEAQETPNTVFGKWRFVPARSTDLATWRYRVPALTIGESANTVFLRCEWMEGKRSASVDSFAIIPGGAATSLTVSSPQWNENWYMGVLAKENSPRTITGSWIEGRSALRVVSEQTVLISQGETSIRTTREYRLTPDGSALTVTEKRSSRPTPVTLVFERMPQQ